MADGKPAGRPFDAVAYARFVIDGIAAKLERAGRDEGRTKALWLLHHVTGIPFGDVASRGIRPLLKEQWDELGRLLDRVAAGEPVQHVVGNADFMGRVFNCDKRALIPRPETEELVAAVVALAKAWPRPPMAASSPARLRIVDVGTGTGCIAITLALELPGADLLATDISAAALALAGENAAAHNAAVAFRQTDLLAGFEPAGVDLVVSNPPYIADGEAAALAPEIREHEPHAALFAGPDGLDVIRRLIGQAATVLRPGGAILLEIGETQADAVTHLMVRTGFSGVTVRKDLAGHDRIVQGHRSSE